LRVNKYPKNKITQLMSKCKENYPVKYRVHGILITQSGTQHQCCRV
jgi:hypothetical protein